MSQRILLKTGLLLAVAVGCAPSMADSLSQAKRIHDRLTGVVGEQSTLQQMADLIDDGQSLEAATLAMQHPDFLNVTIKNWVAPWTNEEADVFTSLNDYTATVIGIVRDDLDYRLILTGDIVYAASDTDIPTYSTTSNAHYEALETSVEDFSAVLMREAQSSLSSLPTDATAGVMTTRTGAKSFFKDGTNRAMLRFTFINHLCTDFEALKDVTLPPDRIRQDVSRSPGGDSRIFSNSCVGCHSGMDPLAQAFAYYEYDYDIDADPAGDSGQISYNAAGDIDPETLSRVTAKHRINATTFPLGFVIENDNWDNYWRSGINQTLGWSSLLSGSGSGAKSLGEELANSTQFAQCQVTKVFENICLRSPQDEADRSVISANTTVLMQNGYVIKPIFAATADYCKGE